MAKRQNRKMDVQVALRISFELDQQIEAWIADMRPKPSKSAAIRELIEEGLKAITAEKPEKPARGRKP
jgi:hypothetical protein